MRPLAILSTLWEVPPEYINYVAPRQPDLLADLNVDVIHDHILPYLDISSLKQLSLTCSTLGELVESYLSAAQCLLITAKTRRLIKEKQMLCLAMKTKRLLYLDVSECTDAVTNATLKCFINRNRDIRLLNISRCIRVNLGAFQSDGDNPQSDDYTPILPLSKLEIFIANWCRNVCHECLVSLSHAPLRVVSIAGTWYTTDQAIADCITFFKEHLECLNVNKCYKVSNASFNLLPHCKKLRIVKLSSCWRINDEAVDVVMGGCKSLQQLVIDDCRAITRDKMLEVSERGLLLLEGCIGGAEKLWDNSQHYLKRGFRF